MSSDDNASFVDQDDLSILELVLLGDILTEYNFYQHVASDVGIDELYLNPQGLSTQINLDKISPKIWNILFISSRDYPNKLKPKFIL